MVITIASLLDPERAYRSIVWQSRDYTQHFRKYSTHHTTTATKSSVRNILKRQASTITEEGFQNFDLSVSGSFRLTTNQIRESKSNRLEQLRIFIVLHFGRVSPSLVISIFFLLHLI
jgi:hypothetical protein